MPTHREAAHIHRYVSPSAAMNAEIGSRARMRTRKWTGPFASPLVCRVAFFGPEKPSPPPRGVGVLWARRLSEPRSLSLVGDKRANACTPLLSTCTQTHRAQEKEIKIGKKALTGKLLYGPNAPAFSFIYYYRAGLTVIIIASTYTLF